MNIALVLTPAWSREMPHLAIAMLSACLRKKSYDVVTFDFNNDFYYKCKEKYKTKWKKEQDSFWADPVYIAEFVSENNDMIDQSVENILSSAATIIGFSVYYTTEFISLEIARRIKEIDKEKIIIFGGFQCLRELRGKAFIENPAVDIVVIGEGEETIVEIADIIARDGKVDFCKGALLKKDNSFIDCGNRPPIKNLNSLPFSDFKDFSLSLYETPNGLPFLFGRSCFQQCVYCTVKSFWNTYRSMNADRMFQEIKFHLNNFNNINEIYFYDSLINGNIKELSQLCDLIIEAMKGRTLPRIRWHAQGIIRPEMTLELLLKMKKAGCYRLAYGIESGSQNVLNKMRKNFNIVDAERIIRYTHVAGINVVLNFMFGFPSETEEDFQKTLDFITINSKYIYEVLPSESFCYIDKGTYLYEHPEEFSFFPNPHSNFWESIDGKNNYLERLRRFEIFCERALSLSIKIGTSYEKIKLFKQQSLDRYNAYKYKERG